MRELHVDRYYEARLAPDGIVHVLRTDTEANDLEDMDEELKRLTASIGGVVGPDRKGPGILMDMRFVRSRNDAEFEAATSRYRKMLRQGFHRVAVLVRTEVGKLHVNRLDREEGTDTGVFVDEHRALAYLRGSHPRE